MNNKLLTLSDIDNLTIANIHEHYKNYVNAGQVFQKDL